MELTSGQLVVLVRGHQRTTFASETLFRKLPALVPFVSASEALLDTLNTVWPMKWGSVYPLVALGKADANRSPECWT